MSISHESQIFKSPFYFHRKMALTPAEKQRRYRERINADENKRSEYLKKMRERAKMRRELKLDKSVKDMSERGKRQQQIMERASKEVQRKQKKCPQTANCCYRHNSSTVSRA